MKIKIYDDYDNEVYEIQIDQIRSITRNFGLINIGTNKKLKNNKTIPVNRTISNGIQDDTIEMISDKDGVITFDSTNPDLYDIIQNGIIQKQIII